MKSAPSREAGRHQHITAAVHPHTQLEKRLGKLRSMRDTNPKDFQNSPCSTSSRSTAQAAKVARTAAIGKPHERASAALPHKGKGKKEFREVQDTPGPAAATGKVCSAVGRAPTEADFCEKKEDTKDSIYADASCGSDTLSMARAIMESPAQTTGNLNISVSSASSPNLQSNSSNISSNSYELGSLPTEGIISYVEGKAAATGAGFYTHVVLGEVTHAALIDTGSTYTLIPQKLYESSKLDFHPLGSIKLRLASGEHFMTGTWVGPVKFKIGSQWFSQPVVVAESGSEIIIGMDFLRWQRTALLVSDNILLLNGEPIKLIDEEKVSSPKIAAARRITTVSGPYRCVEITQGRSKYHHRPRHYLQLKTERPGGAELEAVGRPPQQVLTLKVSNYDATCKLSTPGDTAHELRRQRVIRKITHVGSVATEAPAAAAAAARRWCHSYGSRRPSRHQRPEHRFNVWQRRSNGDDQLFYVNKTAVAGAALAHQKEGYVSLNMRFTKLCSGSGISRTICASRVHHAGITGKSDVQEKRISGRGCTASATASLRVRTVHPAGARHTSACGTKSRSDATALHHGHQQQQLRRKWQQHSRICRSNGSGNKVVAAGSRLHVKTRQKIGFMPILLA